MVTLLFHNHGNSLLLTAGAAADLHLMYQLSSMEKLTKSVQDFMDNQLVYDNPHNVEITTNEYDAVCIASDWPDEEKSDTFTLEIVFESKTLAEFLHVFGIQGVDDLQHITPAFMLALYQQGKAVICCAVDTLGCHFPMRYRKHNDTIQVTDRWGVNHEVHILLETPQQFIDFTHLRSLTPVS